jgi:hypothetical protein
MSRFQQTTLLPRPKPAVVFECRTEVTAWVSGIPARKAFTWFQRLGIPCQWSHADHGWMVPRSRVADLVADSEQANRPVRVTGKWS